MKPRLAQTLVRPYSLKVATQVASLLLTLLATLPTNPLRAQSDNFDDGDDAGWTRYDRGGTATFSFPNGGYRIQASSLSGGSEQDKAQVFSYRSPDYTDFYVSVDLKAWDNEVRSAIGLIFRTSSIGPNSTAGYSMYWTPAIGGGGNRVFSIYLFASDQPFTAVCATIVTLDTNRTYRMVATGTGDFLEGRLYDLADLTQPVAYISGHDSFFPSGKCGVFGYSRNNTSFDVTFDNYFASNAPPAGVALPGTLHPVPGAPQVVNRIPASNKNFHPPASGVSFTATTLGGNPIEPSGIQLILNGTDGSGNLNITGTQNSRNVSYNGLASNRLYHARIVLTETGGKSSANEFYFDTFSESFLTNSTKIVEAEDYNYSNGQYQNDPPPSGFDASQQQVNGNGVGYLDLPGTPNVDFFDRRTSVEANYTAFRFTDWVGTFAGSLYQLTDGGAVSVTTNDTILQKFAALGLPDYQVHHTEGGEWLNYTRAFVPARYHVYLRSSSFSRQDVLFDEVTSDRTVAGQTTTNLGKFMAINTGHISTYRYFPLVNDQVNPVTLDWTGEKTFRLTMGGLQEDYTRYALQMNYLMFVPVTATPQPFTLINPNREGTTFNVSFATEAGFTYTLLHKNALSDSAWTPGASVAGDGSIKTLSDSSTESERLYRVSAQ